MAREELSPDQIAELYRTYRTEDPWPDWVLSFHQEVVHFRDLDDAGFRSAPSQERLWGARTISGVGPGEAVNTRGATTDPEIVEAFASLRSRRWPEDPDARASEIQEAYDRILGLVHPKHSPTLRPHAKLARALAVLLVEQMHPAFSHEAHRRLVELLLGSRRVELIEGAVLIRARLLRILGPEDDLLESVQRAAFCWWCHERRDALDRGRSAEDVVAPPVERGELPRLVPWPITRQRKGIGAVAGYVEAYRAVVGSVQQGASRDDSVASMRSEFGLAGLSERRCRQLFDRVRLLGLLEHRDGLWYPSADGERLLEEDPPDILVERLLVRTFGLGYYLVLLREGPLLPQTAVQRLRQAWPRWTSELAPSAILAWAQSLGLVERLADDRRALTDYGRSWAARLPEEMPEPEPPDPDEEEARAPDDAPVASWPSFAEVMAEFRRDTGLRRFVFGDEQVRALHLAWHCHPRKRFAVLSGLSGTGKTALLVHYARIYCRLAEVAFDRHCAVVPVAPDWRDPSGLLGYFNALHADPTFQAEPALRLVIAAARNPALPYFLILDEMNLARAEQYLAPFLSAMEIADGVIHLHAHDEPINGVPPRIRWPTNLFVGGTVNMDETTHPFSDKVLDRAFTMEFWEVDLPSFLDRRRLDRIGHPEVEALLIELNALLRPIRRHFGYRAADEVLAYLDRAATLGILTPDSRSGLVDEAIFAKILPRIRGEDTPALHQILQQLEARLRSAGLVRCSAKLQEMRDRLGATGVTRFWA